MQPQPEIELSFEQLPSTSILSLLRRHRGTTLPFIKATCDHVTPFDTLQYNKICAFPNQNISLLPILNFLPSSLPNMTHPHSISIGGSCRAKITYIKNA